MKKLLPIIISVVALVSACALISSCNKGAQGLVGTKWVCASTVADVTITETMHFTTDKDVTYTINYSNGHDTETFTGTYTYEYPTVTMTFKTDKGITQYTGTINGNTMVSAGARFVKQ